MQHYDDTTLALIALGETSSTPDAGAHLAECATCRAEVESLAHVVATGRTVTPADYPAAPSPTVWERVQQEIHADHAAASAPIELLADRATKRPSYPRRWVALGAAAAIGLVVGAGGTWAATRGTSSVPVAQGQVVTATLAGLDTPAASGTAVVRIASPAQRTVEVTVVNLPTQPGTFYQVWLMDPSDAHLVSLGVLDTTGHGSYAIPAGLDLALYSAVDVSLQPMNGSPAHSSISAVRGTIPA